MIDEPSPDPSPSPADDGNEEEDIESPFETGTVSYFEISPDEDAFSVELASSTTEVVGTGRIELSVAGPFLQHLGETLHTIAGHIQGLAVGERGPLPTLTGAGAVSLAGFTPGSAVFHFTVGDVATQLSLTEDDGRSAMETAIEILLDLIAQSSSADRTDELLEQTRQLPERAGTKYLDLVNVLVENGISTRWHAGARRARPVALRDQDAMRTKAVLERVVITSVDDVDVVGLLYEANSKANEFRLEPDGERVIQGTFDEALTDAIRGAWGHRVRARVRITQRKLDRSREQRPAEVKLIDLLELLD